MGNQNLMVYSRQPTGRSTLVPGQPVVIGKDHQFILTGVGNQNLMVYSRQPTGRSTLVPGQPVVIGKGHQFISSPEPLGSQGELIGWP